MKWPQLKGLSKKEYAKIYNREWRKRNPNYSKEYMKRYKLL